MGGHQFQALKVRGEKYSPEGNHETLAGILGQLSKRQATVQDTKESGTDKTKQIRQKRTSHNEQLRIGHSNLSNTLHLIGEHYTSHCNHCQ